MGYRNRQRRKFARPADPGAEPAAAGTRSPASRTRRRDLGLPIRLGALAAALVLVGAVLVAVRYGGGLPGISTGSSAQSPVSNTGPMAPEFTGIVDWENSPALTLLSLRDKVVLVDFWTYSCINCQRTFPFLRQWWQKYQADGLVIVGVHSPEFAFEKDVGNVRRAVKTYDVQWPVAVDSNMATWNAYQNQYWPAEYLIDGTGHVRYTSFGEGDYATTERAIRALLSQIGHDVSSPLVKADPGITSDASSETPETYVGTARGDGSVAFHGSAAAWEQQAEYVQLVAPEAPGADYAEKQYQARRVYMVAAPAAGPVTVEVMLDGHDLQPDQAGPSIHFDAAGHATVLVDHDDLYTLVSISSFSKHVLRVVPEQAGFQLYTFTFGS